MKFEATIRVVYEVDSKYLDGIYGTTDPNEAAKIDQGNFEDHPESLLSLVDSEGFTVEVRVVEE